MKIMVYTNCFDSGLIYMASTEQAQAYKGPQSDKHREAIALLDAATNVKDGAAYIAGVGDKRTFKEPPRVVYWLDKEWS